MTLGTTRRTRAPKRLRITAMILVAVLATMASQIPIAGAARRPSLTLSSTTGPAGTSVKTTGARLSPKSSGKVVFGSAAVAQFTTDRKGRFSTSFAVPAGAAAGEVTVTASTGRVSAVGQFTVTASDPAPSLPDVAPPVLLGLSTPSAPRDLTEVDAFESAAGGRADVVMYFQGWAYDEFDPALARAVAARGALPEITWEPWDYRGGLSQPSYTLARIIDGSHDAYITRWAQGAKAYGGPLLMRFAHEMNDRHYPWSEQLNGNRPGEYVAAWRHVVDVFRTVGATNVSWVWSPNVSYAGTTPLATLYPGDAYVDWVAVDGYNGGSALPWGGWQTFIEIFGATLSELATITTAKPVMIGETSSAELGGSKAAWITDFFAQLALHPEIKGFVWFNHNKETDWRIQSSETARQAFATGVAGIRST